MGFFFTGNPFIDSQKYSRTVLRLDGNYNFKLGIPMELFAGTTFTFNERSTSVASISTTTFFENADLGLRLGWKMTDVFYIGTYGYLRALSGTRSPRNTSGGFSTQTGPPVAGELAFTTTLDMRSRWLKVP